MRTRTTDAYSPALSYKVSITRDDDLVWATISPGSRRDVILRDCREDKTGPGDPRNLAYSRARNISGPGAFLHAIIGSFGHARG